MYIINAVDAKRFGTLNTEQDIPRNLQPQGWKNVFRTSPRSIIRRAAESQAIPCRIIPVRVCARVCACVCVHVYVHKRACTCICACACSCACVCVCMCVCVPACACACACAYACACACARGCAHVCAHAHARAWSCVVSAATLAHQLSACRNDREDARAREDAPYPLPREEGAHCPHLQLHAGD